VLLNQPAVVLGDTLLHEAAKHGHHQVVQKLLDLSSEATVETWKATELDGRSPLAWACMGSMEGHAKAVKILDNRGFHLNCTGTLSTKDANACEACFMARRSPNYRT
jgi:ankyrin repeat protein